MYQAIWKLTALAVVVGVGVVVVVQAQRGFNNVDQGDNPPGVPAEPVETALDDADNEFDTLTSQSEPDHLLERFDDENPTVPASAKTSSQSRRRDRSTVLEKDDPFSESTTSVERTSQRADPRPDTRARTAARDRPRLTAIEDDSAFDEMPKATPDERQRDTDDPFSDDKSRRKPGSRERESGKSSRGPALRLNSFTDDETETIGASASETQDEKNDDSAAGPKLLGDDDDAAPRLSPISGSDSDPFSDEESAARRNSTIVPSSQKSDDDDEIAKPEKIESEPKKLPKSADAPMSERESVDDEMPIIERAAPRRKSAAPAVPRADEESEGEADDFPRGIRKRPAEKQEPRRLTTDRDSSISLDDEPIAQPEKSSSRTGSDPFADDEKDESVESQPDLKTTDEEDLAPRGRPVAPALEDDAPVTAPKKQPTTRPPLDDSEVTNESGVEQQPTSPKTPSTIREDIPLVDAPTKEPDVDVVRPTPPSTVESRPAPRRTPQPQLTIDKIAPPTAVLGKPMVYQIVVKNVGAIAARQVVVEDAVPDAARIDGSIPQALLENQRLIWKLGTLEAGREKKILVRMIPQSEGTLGTVATVNCASGADGAGSVSVPQLKFDVSIPGQAVVGTPVALKFRVTNVSDVDASGVVIRNVLPAGLRHPDGDDLEYEIGDLPAGKTRDVELTLTAGQPGKTVNRAIVTADGNVTEEAVASLEIVGPALALTRSGTKRLFPGKTGTYTNTITNPGSTPVTGIRVVEVVPAGMEFVSASDGGQYDARETECRLAHRAPRAS